MAEKFGASFQFKIMIEIKYIDDKGNKAKRTVPNSWDELSLAQVIKISAISSDNVIELFSIITGIPAAVPENSTDKKLEENIWKVVAFIGDPPKWKDLKAPSKLVLGVDAHLVPKRFSKLMIGQKIMIAQCVRKVEDMIEQMPKILAVIFQPIIDKDINEGRFNSDRIDEIAGQMLGVNGISGYAISSSFFLRSKILKSYGIQGLSEYLNKPRQTKKPLRNWLTSNA